MPDAFFLRWKLDRPYVEVNKAEEIFALVTIEPNSAELAPVSRVVLPTHFILLVDVSGSMDFLVRHDPKAQKVGEAVREGRTSQKVISSVPSRREMACTVVDKLARRLQAGDLLTLIAFDHQAYVLATALSFDMLSQVEAAVRGLAKVGGGGTAVGQGMEVLRRFLASAPDVGKTRKLVLLSDGEDDNPSKALTEAQALGRDYHVPISALGMGECKVSFLKELAQTTLAGSFYHLRSETEADQLFQQVLAGQKNVQAINVALNLWLSPEIQVRELYRTRPEVLYVGDLQPDADNMVELRLEQMERGKAYEFLFRCLVPRRTDGQRFRLAKAGLTFDLPSLGRMHENLEANLVVEYTTDPERARERSGDVCRVINRADVQRQILFLQAKIDRVNRGQANDRDRVIVAQVLHALIKKFQDFGDQAMVNQYRQMEEEFRRRGTISQEMLNRSLAASSRAETIIIAQDIDF